MTSIPFTVRFPSAPVLELADSYSLNGTAGFKGKF
jgi:hypothetical protein